MTDAQQPAPKVDDTHPAAKDVAEGARDEKTSSTPTGRAGGEESRLGPAGDPVEGNTGDGSEPGP